MEQLVFAGLVLVWLVLAGAVGHWIYQRKQSRIVQMVAVLIALWLPLWDALPGYLLYRKAVREVGGVRIHRVVRVDGYLNLATALGDCWRRLSRSPYTYCENFEPDSTSSSLGPLNSRAGYYEYRLAPIDAVECAPFREHLDVPNVQSRWGLGPRCVVAIRRDRPVSQFEYDRGSDDLRGPWPVPPVKLQWQRVRDRVSGEIVAQATTVAYVPWILRPLKLGFGWYYSRNAAGHQIVVDPRELVQPLSHNEE